MKLPSASGPVHGAVTPPPSKSLTHRALVAAFGACTPTRIEQPLEAEDTRLTRAALEALGATVVEDAGAWVLTPPAAAGHSPTGATPAGPRRLLHLGNSGTSLRLLLPLAATPLVQAGGEVVLDGIPRLRERPVGPQARALAALGARLHHSGSPDCPPVAVTAAARGGPASLDASDSSQFLSGLLLAAPLWERGVQVQVTFLASRPYVALTEAVMAAFGIQVSHQEVPGSGTGAGSWSVPPGRPRGPARYTVEADASAAAFPLAMAAVAGGRMEVRGVGADSRQGDIRFLQLLAEMGCVTDQGPHWMTAQGRPTRGLVADMGEVPDLVPPLAAVAAFAPAPVRLTGIGHLRLKESDRVAALATELGRLGVPVTQGPDWLAFAPRSGTGGGKEDPALRPAAVSAHGDHRIAMALAVAALAVPGCSLDDPACVAKSWPDFFTVLDGILAG